MQQNKTLSPSPRKDLLVDEMNSSKTLHCESISFTTYRQTNQWRTPPPPRRGAEKEQEPPGNDRLLPYPPPSSTSSMKAEGTNMLASDRHSSSVGDVSLLVKIRFCFKERAQRRRRWLGMNKSRTKNIATVLLPLLLNHHCHYQQDWTLMHLMDLFSNPSPHECPEHEQEQREREKEMMR